MTLTILCLWNVSFYILGGTRFCTQIYYSGTLENAHAFGNDGGELENDEAEFHRLEHLRELAGWKRCQEQVNTIVVED